MFKNILKHIDFEGYEALLFVNQIDERISTHRRNKKN